MVIRVYDFTRTGKGAGRATGIHRGLAVGGVHGHIPLEADREEEGRLRVNPWKEKNTYAERMNKGARRAQFASEMREERLSFTEGVSVALGCFVAAAVFATASLTR